MAIVLMSGAMLLITLVPGADAFLLGGCVLWAALGHLRQRRDDLIIALAAALAVLVVAPLLRPTQHAQLRLSDPARSSPALRQPGHGKPRLPDDPGRKQPLLVARSAHLRLS